MSGEVLHADTGLPLPGATVVLVGGGAVGTERPGETAFLAATRSTTTDALGRYAFRGVMPGLYTLRVFRLGFRPAAIDVQLRGMDSRVSVGLSVIPIKLQPLNITVESPEPYARMASTSEEQSRARTAALEQRQRAELATDVRELTHVDVTEAVTLGETDLFRALQRLPGVSTRDEFTAELWTRGGRWDETRVLFDGLPLFNPVSGLGAYSSVNADVIGGATLFPGVKPASLPEGTAGVLDLRTRPAGGRGELRGVGELSIASARLTLDQRVAGGRGGWLVAARRSYLDAVMPLFVSSGSDRRFPFHLSEVTGRFDWQLSADRSIEVSALRAADHITGDVNDFVEGNRAHWGNSAARVTLAMPIGPLSARHTLGASIYNGRMSVQPNDSAPVEASGESPERPVRARVRHFTLGTALGPGSGAGRRWSAGANIVIEQLEAAGDVRAIYTGDALSSERARWTSALPRLELWGERRVEPTARLSIDLGTRLDMGGRVENGSVARVSPRVVARFAVDEATNVSAGVGRTFQYTQAIPPWGGMSENIAYPIPLWSLASRERPALRADVATVGVDRWIGHAWQASANAYARRSTGVLQADPTPGPVTTHAISVVGTESASGIELGMRRVAGRATVATGYSFGIANVEAGGFRFRSPQDRRHELDLTTMVRPSRGFRMGVAYTVASGAPFTRRHGGSYGVDGERKFWIEPPTVEAPNAGRSPPTASLDLLIDWTGKIRRFRIGTFVQLHNALDRDNPGTYAGLSFCSEFDRIYNGCVPVDRFDDGLPRLPVAGIRVAF
jgi:hypothetical protein